MSDADSVHVQFMFIFSLCNKEQAFLKLGQFQQCLIFNLVQWYNRVGIDIAVSVILNTIFVNNLHMHDITAYANKLASFNCHQN